MDRKITKYTLAAVLGLLGAVPAQAREIDMNTVQMQAMDKITGRVSVIEAPVNSEIRFGSFSIVVRACKTRPPEETPENYAFVDVVDNYNGENPVNIFKGWMLSSSPALNAVEHPIYDVWLLQCLDGTVDRSKLLTAEQLKARDEIVKAPEKKPETEIKPVEPTLEAEPVVPAAEEAENTETAAETEVKVEEPLQEVVLPEINTDEDAPKSLINISAEEKAPAETAVKAATEEASPLSVPAVEAEPEQTTETPAPADELLPLPEQPLPHNPAPVEEVSAVTEDIPEAEPLRDEQFIDFSSEEVPEEGYDLNVEALKVQ